MECQRSHDLIPLFVGDDLDDETLAAVQTHLGGCRACRKVADEHRAAVALVRDHGGLAAEAAFYDSLRADVRSRLEAEAPPSRLSVRLALAAAVAAAVLAGLVFVAVTRSGSRPDEPHVVREASPEAVVAPPDRRPSPAPDPPRIAAERPRSRREPSRHAAPLAGGETAVTKIEFQTGDPNVRIIWFVPSQETTRVPNEETGS